jgi:glutamate/tyrosine decarboxylase-like PLP-dependent enzyme
MNLDDLRQQIKADASRGDRPFLVVGTAGSVSTGAVDALPEIAEICREHDLWFHVDGAYGAFAAAVPGTPSDLRGLGEADSVAVDPHKWLYAPLEAGCALVKQPEHLRNAFSYHPPYYRFGEEALNFVDYGLQNSRGFRALKVWLALQQLGRTGYVDSMAEDIRLSQRLFALVKAHPEFEALTQNLSIATFRYVPSALRSTIGDPATEATLEKLNRKALERIEKDGRAFLSNAVINGKYAMRACIVNFRTSDADIDALPEIIAALSRPS